MRSPARCWADPGGLAQAEPDRPRCGYRARTPDDLARWITTLFAQFERLVDSTRDFYTYLSEVLRRFHLNPDEFKAYKDLLIDYLYRFVEEIGCTCRRSATRSPASGRTSARWWIGPTRGKAWSAWTARGHRGLDVDDWPSLAAWFLGEPGREVDAVQVRRLATEAMNALLSNLRPTSPAEREAQPAP